MTRCLLAVSFTFHTAFAQDLDFLSGLDSYRPRQSVTGTIRSRVNNYALALMKLWEEGFRKHHPGVHFETTLNGSETAIAGLYSGVADLGFLAREIYQQENAAFKEFNPHKTFALTSVVTSKPANGGRGKNRPSDVARN